MTKLKGGLKPDLLITDLNMPGMNGIEFIKEVRKLPNLQFMPILFLTTESQQSKRDEAKAAGASGWLIKAGECGTTDRYHQAGSKVISKNLVAGVPMSLDATQVKQRQLIVALLTAPPCAAGVYLLHVPFHDWLHEAAGMSDNYRRHGGNPHHCPAQLHDQQHGFHGDLQGRFAGDARRSATTRPKISGDEDIINSAASDLGDLPALTKLAQSNNCMPSPWRPSVPPTASWSACRPSMGSSTN